MSDPKKGMSSEQASLKKISGHINESDYAELIGVKKSHGDGKRKKDVVDLQGNAHSVKSGKKWQIFLYAKSRLQSNTVLQGIGDIAPLMIACINSLPKTREERESNPAKAKSALQAPMRALADELQKPHILNAFFQKAAFEAGEVDYWALLPTKIDQTQAAITEKCFHVFDAKEAVRELCRHLVVGNSRARHRGETDAQKVVFRDKQQIGEIELRTDKFHYGEIKMWLNAKYVVPLLQERIPMADRHANGQIIAYGKARRFKPSNNPQQ